MGLTELIVLALVLYRYVLLARIVLSWATMVWSPPPALTPIIRVIYELTEPVMAFVRRYIPPVGGLDLSPIVIFLLISFIIGSL